MAQDQYLFTDTEVDRLRELFESFHYMVFEFIESRRLKIPPWEEGPEMKNFNSIYQELDNLAQQKFDF